MTQQMEKHNLATHLLLKYDNNLGFCDRKENYNTIVKIDMRNARLN